MTEATKRRIFRMVVPKYPAFNVYSHIAKKTTALGPLCVATSVSRMPGWDVEVIDENNYRFPGPVDEQGLPEHTGYGWYRVSWKVPTALRKKHVYLLFSAVDEQAWVWINGRSVGEHTLASRGLTLDPKVHKNPAFRMFITPFWLEVGKSLRYGAVNSFAVRVLNRGGSGGVYKPVHLIATDSPLTKKSLLGRALRLDRKILQSKDPEVRYDVWTTYAYDPVFPDTPSPLEAGNGERKAPSAGITLRDPSGRSDARSHPAVIRAAGACGELVPLAIHVKNRAAATLPIRLDFPHVRHKDYPFILTADRFKVRFVDYVWTKLKKLAGDPLPRVDGANGLRIAPGKTAGFFVLIDTKGLPAGTWKGHVKLTPLLSGAKLEIPSN